MGNSARESSIINMPSQQGQLQGLLLKFKVLLGVRFRILLLIAVPAILIGLKVVQVWIEPGSAHRALAEAMPGVAHDDAQYQRLEHRITRNWTKVPETGYGVMRRIEDASFWITVAAVIACVGIYRTARRIQSELWWQDPTPQCVTVTRWCFLLLGIALAYGYLLVVLRTHGTVFWWLRGSVRGHADWQWWSILGIQLIEGCLILFVIAMVALIGRTVVLCGRSIAHADPDKASEAQLFASELLTWCISPFALIFVIFTLYNVLIVQAGFVKESKFWAAIMLLGYMPFAMLPLIVAVVYCTYRWFNLFGYSVHFGKEGIRIEATRIQ